MISIIIPAHNERGVIARGLEAIISGSAPDEIEIIVVCNGCTDDTAEIARRFVPIVRVIETDVASKTNALNIGDSIARFFPRVYIDADVVIKIDAVRELVQHLAKGNILAVAPVPILDLTGCSACVRAYYAVRSRLPSARQGLGGSGVYALSRTGRARFGEFPKITADDAYVRLQFSPQERETISSATSTVYAPRTLHHLRAIRARIYYGTQELSRSFPEIQVNTDTSNIRTLLDLTKRPGMWFGLAIYFYVNIIARYLAHAARSRASFKWGHDQSSRRQAA
jgi:glycosyltransferase involved in cell wall biosynthesis